MAKLYLKLENENGQVKEFKKEKIKAYWVKRCLQHSKKIQELEAEGKYDELVDERVNFTCEIFGDKELTPELIYNGLESDELIQTLTDILNITAGNKPADGEPGK